MSEPHEPSSPARSPEPRVRWLYASAPLLVALVTVALLAWTWGRCPELITDFGREAYVPWRITQGEVLYRDVNYFNGPLSPYLNAALFEVFGASLRTMKVANATLAVIAALLVYGMTRRIGDALGGLVMGVTFAVLFAAAHLMGMGNFNWLTPYSHDLTHGVALSLAMLACLWRAQARGAARWVIVGGLTYGLVLLTKVEVALAASVGAAAALVLMTSARTLSPARLIASFALPALAAPVLAVALLAQAMPLPDAARAAAGAWLWLGDTRIGGLPLFRWVAGTDEPERNLIRLLAWLGCYALLSVAAVGLSLAVKRGTTLARVVAVAAAILVALVMELTWTRVPWTGMLRPLPVVLLLVLVGGVAQGLNRRAPAAALLPRVSLAAFALALLLKIVLNTRAFHYGFALAVPGTMVLVALLVTWLPAWVRRQGGEAWVARGIVLAVVAVLLRAHLASTRHYLAKRDVPIGAGPDEFLTDARGRAVSDVIAAVAAHRRPGDTLVALPEGAMINFLLRMPSTSRYLNFLPSEMMIYGERAMLDGLANRPPTYVVLVHRVAGEYAPDGTGRFGVDYGAEIGRWVHSNYRPVMRSGADPFRGDDFGAMLLQRNDGGDDPASSSPVNMPP